MSDDEMKVLKIAKVKTMKSLLFFTRFFFKKVHKRKFVVNSHHREITETLEKVMRGEITRLIINMPPRYGKTEIVVRNFIAHCFALNPTALFMHLSGSKKLALDNSEDIRNIIMSEEYQQMFPNVRIKTETNAKENWKLTEGGGIYATSAGGQVIGFGAGQVDEEKAIKKFISTLDKKTGFSGAIVIDDAQKPDEADSEVLRNKINNRYDSTIKTRTNSRNTPIIILMHRLHPEDLCGHVLKGKEDWTVLSIPAIYEDEDGNEKALWDFKHTLEELYTEKGTSKYSMTTFERQYMQNPKPTGGLLYSEFREYNELPTSIIKLGNFTDPADTGNDYLCSINYAVDNHGNIFVTDVYYTDLEMKVTEIEVPKMLINGRVRFSVIESNNGGKGFARNVERYLQAFDNDCTIIPRPENSNKEQRIMSNSTQVNKIFMPEGWYYKYPEFYNAITDFKYIFKANKNDDGADTLTGIYLNEFEHTPREGVRIDN